MKIGILTFHGAHNFGSMLQAYALQQTIISMGYECEIINLRTDNQKQMYDYRNFFLFEKNPIKKLIKKFLFVDRKKQFDAFEKFLENRLILTEEYRNIDEFNQSDREFDVYISGSDQIWNINTDDFDSSYMLDFDKVGKRIAYAASAGSGECDFTLFKDKLLKYDAIGVREISLCDNLYKNYGIKSKVTLDPTLLLDEYEWLKIRNYNFEKKLPKEYILFYSLGYESAEKEILKYLQNHYKLPIVTPHRLYSGEIFQKNLIIMDGCGPEEFVSLFYRATHIFTTSFHGCAFSVIFHKHFFAYLLNEGHIDQRKKSLLEITDTEKCGVTSLGDIQSILNQTSAMINKKSEEFQKERIESLAFLKNSIANV